MLAEMGIALDLVAAIVGHELGGKDTRTLVRHYVHTDMLERKAHALKAWDERLKGDRDGRGSREGGATGGRVSRNCCEQPPLFASVCHCARVAEAPTSARATKATRACDGLNRIG